MSQTPFKNVRGDNSPAAVVAVPTAEAIAPVGKMDNPAVNGDTSDVGQSHPPEIPSPMPAVTNPGAGFKVRA